LTGGGKNLLQKKRIRPGDPEGKPGLKLITQRPTYLEYPTLLGAGVGLDLLAQAPRLRAEAAIATTAKILTNFTVIFPLLS